MFVVVDSELSVSFVVCGGVEGISPFSELGVTGLADDLEDWACAWFSSPSSMFLFSFSARSSSSSSPSNPDDIGFDIAVIKDSNLSFKFSISLFNDL